MIACRIISKADAAFADCAAIRLEVFVNEQQVPPDEEMDELDVDAIHVIATKDGETVGTGRLITEDPTRARIGRMAVLAQHRRAGVGSAILTALMDAARSKGITQLTLAGQLHAIPFYERFGFVAHGEVFLDAGIEHRTMDREI